MRSDRNLARFYCSVDESIGSPRGFRDVILASSNLNISSWNKNNLCSSIKKSKTSLNVFHFDIYIDGNNDYVYLKSREKLDISSIFSYIPDNSCCIIFLNLANSNTSCDRIHDAFRLIRASDKFICFTYDDNNRFLFSLFCEIKNFLNVRGVYGNGVNARLLFDVLENIVESYCYTTKNESIWTSKALDDGGTPLWESTNRFSDYPDIEHFALGSGEEHISDAIRRMLDCASSPRRPDHPFSQRMVSSESLFQLAQVACKISNNGWLEQTRFFQELHPDAFRQGFSLIKRREHVPERILSEFIENLVQIPASRYCIGTSREETGSEPPASERFVELPLYHVSRHPVTEKLWTAIIEGKNSSSTLPKTGITFFDADRFCHLLNELLTDKLEAIGINGTCRLPSEIHWEAAARGPEGLHYPWGNEFLEGVCNYNSQIGKPTPVGNFSPRGDSPYGLTDMAGNVREWTSSYAGTKGSDWIAHAVFSTDTKTLNEYSRMVVRGGSYVYYKNCIYCWMRNPMIASSLDVHTGFRIAVYK